MSRHLGILLSLAQAAWMVAALTATAQESPYDPRASGQLTVKNQSGDRVSIWLAVGDRVGDVAAGETKRFPKVRAGTQRMRAMTGAMDRVWETELLVGRDPSLHWTFGAPEATGIRVANNTKESLDVFVERILWLVVPANGVGVIYSSGSPTTRMMSARNRSGKIQYSPRLMSVQTGTLREWTIGIRSTP